ncbi:SpoIIE family protein phosphatase [Thermobifida cellulosilytica]|uniref:SpoIIE family protein phosphatase n=1 Tax=Thermobifida cellulosilytica TaxID=144786 RepID=UPI0008390452|nr:SpoIIE family protein phosphatase [Thermobifida cellulosilytica]
MSSDHHDLAHPAPLADPDLPRKVLDGIGIGVYLTNDREQIIAANPQAVQMLGRPESEMVGRNAHDLLHRGAGGVLLPRSQCRLMKAFLQGHTTYGGDKWFLRGDGSLLPVVWLTSPYRIDADTTGAAVLFHSRDPRDDTAGQDSLDRVTRLTDLADSLSLIAEATSALTSTLQVREALWRLVRLVTPRLADWAVVDLVDEAGDVERVLAVHHEGDRHVRAEELQGPMPPVLEASTMPLSRVLRGAPATRLGPEDYRRPPDAGMAVVQRELLDRTRMHSAVAAPLRGPRGSVLGALTLGRADQPGDFDATELALVDDLARQAGLAVDNARLYERQQRVTETMQRYLLPPLPRTTSLEMAVRYRPAPHASHVGGDWYDVFGLQDGTSALVVGDMVGHDLQAAAHMAQLRNMLRALAWDRDEQPSGIVERLDRALGHISEASTATMVFARLEGRGPGPRLLRWTNAGHPPPLLVFGDGRTRFLEEGHGLLLGTDTDLPRTDAVTELPVASTVVLYTDGLVESPRHGLDEGMARLRRHAAALARHGVDDFCDRLIERVRPDDNDDDVAVIVLRIPDPG